MSNLVHFREAPNLKSMYEKDLLEVYDYTNSSEILWFTSISKYFKIIRVLKINNPELYGMYLLWKEEFGNSNLYPSGNLEEYILYHATSQMNAERIARENIDWRKTRRSRFGKGACFSPNPRYADKYSSSNNAFVIFKVLTKNIERGVNVNYHLRVPTKKEFDTTMNYGGDVIVKYDDYQFYPQFIVFYC